MDSNWLKPNVYVIENGKLVPRPTTPQSRKNYRYIHYDPFTNPTPQDYFRETISRLQKENIQLQSEIRQVLQDQSARVVLNAQGNNLDLIKDYQQQIAALKQELARKDRELAEKNEKLNLKDKQILEISNQNSRLHLRINSVVKQIQALNKIMSKKDEEITNKKQQIEEYCKTLEKLAVKDKEEERTAISQSYLMTPRIEEKGHDEQDQYSSLEYNSLSERNGTELDRRYMTPNLQPFRLQERNQYVHRTQQQKYYEQMMLKSPVSRNKPSQPAQMCMPNEPANQSSKELLDSFKDSLWSSSARQKGGQIAQPSSAYNSNLRNNK